MKRARGVAALGVVASLTVLAGVASAQGTQGTNDAQEAPRAPPRFGEQGQLAISNDVDLGFLAQSTSDGGGTTMTLSIAPAVDYFVLRGLSLGGQLFFTHTDDSGSDITTNVVAAGPRVGYALPLGDHFSFWPRVAVLVDDTTASASAASGGASTSGGIFAFDVQVFAPLLWHPRPHFFLGLGPFFQTDSVSSLSAGGTSVSWAKTTTYGVKLDLGGWVSPGEPAHDLPEDSPTTPALPPERRFGDRGVLAIARVTST